MHDDPIDTLPAWKLRNIRTIRDVVCDLAARWIAGDERESAAAHKVLMNIIRTDDGQYRKPDRTETSSLPEALQAWMTDDPASPHHTRDD